MENIGDWNIFWRLIISAALGGLVGAERELFKKPAGLRTHMLVAISVTSLVFLGHIIILEFGEGPARALLEADPTRIIQAIVIGISFIGGGAILKDREETAVKNLTTAASILLTSSIGIMVALDRVLLAFGTALLALSITFGLRFLEKKL